ncbi:helix-turn-helix domain-containing protein [Arthrobacter tumbae]
MTSEEVLALPPSMDLEAACKALGISRVTGYRLVKAGEFPCPVVRLGRVIRVPKPGLLRVLGLDQSQPISND